MPDGSPVLDYLVDLKRHLSVGPPVMFVVNSTQLDYADPKVQNALCGGEGCSADSLQAQARLSIELNCPPLMLKSIIHHVIYACTNSCKWVLKAWIGSAGSFPLDSYDSISQIKLWSLQSNISHIATPSQSWVDDYVAWLGLCCSKDENTGEYCQVSIDSIDLSVPVQVEIC